MVYAVVRARGTVNVRGDIRDTLRMLRLGRVNHCVLLPENSYSKGMLQKVKDYVTWGEISPQVLSILLQRRARLSGNRPLTKETLVEVEGYKSYRELTKALLTNTIQMKDLKAVKPLFRLHPPRKGWGGVKRSYVDGGALGYRGKAINELLRRMA